MMLILMLPLKSRAQTANAPITGSSGTLSIASGYPSNSGATLVDNAITLYTGMSYTGFTVSIASGGNTGDVLGWSAAAVPSGVTASYNSITQILTFSGSGTAAAYQALLRTVTINSTSAPASNKTVTFNVGSTLAFNGHYYEFVAATNVTWLNARNAAATRTLFGQAGYLATITSAAENAFIAQKLAKDGWIGASDAFGTIDTAAGSTLFADQTASEGHWYWVTGPEKGTNFSNGDNTPVTVSGGYANWSVGTYNEPNNSGSSEDYAEMYYSTASWNDLDNNNHGNYLNGYVTEYGGMAGDPVVTLSASRDITYTCTAPVAFSVTGGGTRCFGGSTLPIDLSGSETGVNYQLYRGTTAVGSTLAGTNSAITFPGQATAGTYTVTAIRALGSCTTAMTGSAVITVNTAPAFTCSGNLTANTDLNNCTAIKTYNVSATGTPAPALAYTFSGVTSGSDTGTGSGATFNKGITNVLVTATNSCGSSTCTFTITVSDNQVPAVTCAGNAARNTGMADCTYSVQGTEFDATATDNCGVTALTYVLSGATLGTGSNTLAGVPFNQGITNITWTAKDAANLTSTCSATVTVTDNVLPVITCPANIVVNNTPGVCGATLSIPSPAVTDNCSTLTLGNALNFDGDDIAFVASSSAINQLQTQRTAEVWFRVANKSISSHKQVIWEEGATTNGLNLYVYKDSLFAGVYSEGMGFAGTWLRTANIQSGQWHNAVLVFDGTQPASQRIKAYLDGVLFGTGSSSTSQIAAHGGENAVGGMYNGGKFHDGDASGAIQFSHYFTGDIDEIRLWTTARTPAQLSANVYKKLTGNETGLVVYYDFDQGVACGNNTGLNTLTDRTATHLNGTFSGFNTNGSTSCTSNWTNGAPALSSSITLTNNFTNSSSASSTYPIGTTNIVWTAKDAANNTTTCTQIVTVNAPEINVAGGGQAIASGDMTPAATDSTDFGSVSSGNTITKTFTVSNTGTAPLSISAITMGGAESASFSVNAPALPAVVAVNSSATFSVTCNAVTVGIKTATINIANTDCDEAAYTYAIKAAITCSMPAFSSCPANMTANTDPGACSAMISYSPVTTGQPVPAMTYVFTGATSGSETGTGSGAAFNKGTTHVQVSAANTCGTVACNFDVVVEDHENPTVSAPANITRACQDDLSPATTGMATGADNCPAVIITYTDASTQDMGSTTTPGHYNYTITRTWRATDASGNYSEAAQTITVQDITAPIIVLPAAITVNCQDNMLPAATGTATATDACSPVTISYADTSNQHASADSTGHYNYTTTRIWTATDVSGNHTDMPQTITVQDATAPAIIVPAAATVDCQASTSPSITGTATAIDACSPATISYTDVSNQDANAANVAHYNYTITRTWTATDISGNHSDVPQVITVHDVTAPAITVPAAITVNCQDNILPAATGMATGTDACSPVTVSYADVSTQAANASNAAHYNYSITRTWTATDVAGNANTGTQIITVQDVTAPAITPPAAITLNCQDNMSPAVAGTATATDACSAISISYADASNQNAILTSPAHYNYTITRTWTATDASGNHSDMPQTITVQDVTPPVIVIPAAITVNCQDNMLPAATGMATGTDACSPVTIAYADVSNQNAGITNAAHYNYTITRTWTATDASGNASTDTQAIAVHDVTAPVLTVPAATTVSCQGNTTPAATGTATATDACSPATVTYSDVSNQSSNTSSPGYYNYTITRTWTGTDASGNHSDAAQIITMQDGGAPTIIVPPAITVNCQDNTLPAATGTATVSNSCSPATITYIDVSTRNASATSSAHYNYTITRTWTATDVSGNHSDVPQVITVHDVTAPTLVVPTAITVNCQDNMLPAATGIATGTDACSPVTISYADISTQNASLTNAAHYNFTITRTWTATDVSGNHSDVAQVITVHDVTAPALTVPAAITVNCENAMLPATTGTATATDACSPVTITYSDASNQNASPTSAAHYNYTITRTWTATDASGNHSDMPQVITVHDITAPALTVPAAITVNCQDNVLPANTGTATGTDACSPVTITYSDISTQNANLASAAHYNYTITRTWTATDVAGNHSDVPQVITVHDVTAPAIAVPAAITVNCQDNVLPAATGTATGTDACSAVTISYADVSTQNASATNIAHYNYTVTRTWTATDVSGNHSDMPQIITVHDVTAPGMVVPAAVTTNCQDNAAPAMTGMATGTDACSPVAITYADASTQNVSVASSAHYNYTITRTWTATDVAGNHSDMPQVITVHDITAPALTTPAAITVNCQDNMLPAATGTATAADACSPVTISYTDASNQNASPTSAAHYNYTITRTWTATDASGNHSDAPQVITVQDVTPPVIVIPAAITLNCQDNTLPANTGTATGMDACSPVTITYSDVSTQTVSLSGTGHYNYTITRTWKATDVSGNHTDVPQTITVHDVTAPAIQVPASVTVSCQGNTTPAATGTATGTDACSPVTITYTEASTQSSNSSSPGYYNYVITRTWTATDASGNHSDVPQAITVQSLTPSLVAPAAVTVNCQDNILPAATGTATATNACSPVTISYADVSTQSANVASAAHYNYTITRTWTATDLSGNHSDVAQVITVHDVTAPTVTAPASVAHCDNGSGNSTSLTATGSDICASPLGFAWTVTGATTASGTGATATANFNVGTSTITWTVTDAAGNANSSGTTTVTIYGLPVVTALATNPACNGQSNGAIATTTTGGAPAYSYLWTPGNAVTPNRNSLPAGTYAVAVTDLHGCTGSTSTTLTQPAVLSGSATGTFAVPSCPAYNIYLGYGAQNDTLSAPFSGGTAPYTYAWSGTGTSFQTSRRVVTPTATTAYTAIVTDSHGCTATTSYQVKVLDVHCGPAYIGRERNNTVWMCHAGVSACVSPTQAAGYINAGECLGQCATSARPAAGNGSGSGVNESSYTGTITVYPNPAHNTVNVSLSGIGSAYKAYQVIDLSGKLVAQQYFEEGSTAGDVDVIAVNVSGYVPGVYLIRVTGKDNTGAVARFTVE